MNHYKYYCSFDVIYWVEMSGQVVRCQWYRRQVPSINKLTSSEDGGHIHNHTSRYVDNKDVGIMLWRGRNNTHGAEQIEMGTLNLFIWNKIVFGPLETEALNVSWNSNFSFKSEWIKWCYKTSLLVCNRLGMEIGNSKLGNTISSRIRSYGKYYKTMFTEKICLPHRTRLAHLKIIGKEWFQNQH